LLLIISSLILFFYIIPPLYTSTLFPYTTLFRSISIALSIFACDNDTKKADSQSTTDSLALQQKEPIRLSDEELISKLLRIKNNSLKGPDSVYYREVIKRPSDSSFTALNLYGKTKQENKLKEFKQTDSI